MGRGHDVQPSRSRSSVRHLMAVNPQDRLFWQGVVEWSTRFQLGVLLLPFVHSLWLVRPLSSNERTWTSDWRGIWTLWSDGEGFEWGLKMLRRSYL